MSEVPPTIKRGSTGDAVKGLQNALRALSYNVGSIDGVFGNGTETALKEFQRQNGLSDDGIAGPHTWAALHIHLVASGETLSRIAEEELGEANRWPEVFDLNRELVADPDKIHPGQVLALPSAG